MTTSLNLREDPEIEAMDRRRGHHFQPPLTQLRPIPALYATEHVATRDKVVWLHYFGGSWDWWIVELDPDTFQAFGFVRSPLCPNGEWGNIDLAVLAVTPIPATINGIPAEFAVERDCWWSPTSFADIPGMNS